MTLEYKTEPYSYQKELVERIVNDNIPFYGIFLEQGLGKSKIALDVANNRLLRGQLKRVYIICPASLIPNWEEEIRTHTNWFETDTSLWEYVSYGVLSYEKGLPPSATCFDLFILDESHYLKTPNSGRTKYLIKYLTVKNTYTGEIKNAPQLLSLTGTPVTKDSRDLFIQTFLLQAPIGKWPYKVFIDTYFTVDWVDYRTLRPINLPKGVRPPPTARMAGITCNDEARLMSEFKGIATWLKKKDCLDLPQKTYHTRYYELSMPQRRAYSKLLKESIIAHDNGEGDETFIKKTVQTFFQICSGFVVTENEYGERKTMEITALDKNPKIQVLQELVETLPPEPLIIYVAYRYDVMSIFKKLTAAGYTVALRHGSMSNEEKQQAIEDFKTGKKQILLATVQSSSTGLNLTHCHRIIYYSLSFELVHLLQSEDRIHRIGQENECEYYYLVAKPEEIHSIAGNRTHNWPMIVKNYEFADHKLLKKLKNRSENVNVLHNLFNEILLLDTKHTSD